VDRGLCAAAQADWAESRWRVSLCRSPAHRLARTIWHEVGRRAAALLRASAPPLGNRAAMLCKRHAEPPDWERLEPQLADFLGALPLPLLQARHAASRTARAPRLWCHQGQLCSGRARPYREGVKAERRPSVARAYSYQLALGQGPGAGRRLRRPNACSTAIRAILLSSPIGDPNLSHARHL